MLLVQLSANDSNNQHNQTISGTQQTTLLDENSEFPEFFAENIALMPNLGKMYQYYIFEM